MPGTGTATINFGAHPGSNEATVAFADTAIISTSKVEAFFMGSDTSGDHTAGDHRYAAALIGLTASPTNGVGGNIYARSVEKFTGQFTVRWVWAD